MVLLNEWKEWNWKHKSLQDPLAHIGTMGDEDQLRNYEDQNVKNAKFSQHIEWLI